MESIKGIMLLLAFLSSSLLHAWHSIKTELASRASMHANFANQVDDAVLNELL